MFPSFNSISISGKSFFHGNLGISVYLFPQPVMSVIMRAVPYDIALFAAGHFTELVGWQ